MNSNGGRPASMKLTERVTALINRCSGGVCISVGLVYHRMRLSRRAESEREEMQSEAGMRIYLFPGIGRIFTPFSKAFLSCIDL